MGAFLVLSAEGGHLWMANNQKKKINWGEMLGVGVSK
jgi:hypothetical protein